MKLSKNLSITIIGVFIFTTILSTIIFWYFFSLPDVRELENYQPIQATRIFDINNKLISEFFNEKRVVVPLKKMPDYFINAIIATEDHEFYKHWGIDMTSIARAFLKNMLAGEIVQGGSTLTQQLAKNLFLSSERTFIRKLKEVILTLQIEMHYSKKEILEFYCNQIFFGQGAYGAESASQTFFEKPVFKLNLAEAAYLAGFIQAPTLYSPYKNPKLAKKRQLFVLKRMLKANLISGEEYEKTKDKKVNFAPYKYRQNKAPYFTEYIRKMLEKKFDEKTLYEGGLSVYTTLDLRIQQTAEINFKKYIKEKNDALGKYEPRFPEKGQAIEEKIQKETGISDKKELLKYLDVNKLLWGTVKTAGKEKAVISLGWGVEGILPLDGIKWIKKQEFREFEEKKKTGFYRARITKVNDALAKNHLVRVKVTSVDNKKENIQLSLHQEQTLQGAVLAIEPQTGFIKAMIGGYNYAESPLNRAVQTKRQPGSAFKPFIYTAAVDMGFTGAKSVVDAPVTFPDNSRENEEWSPSNYYGIYYGPVTLRKALSLSLNIASIKLLQETGINKAIEYAKLLGIKSPLVPNFTLALGTSEVTLLEITSAYSIYANEGVHVEPMAIKMIKDVNGNILEKYNHIEHIALKEDVNYIMVDILQAVTKEGTGRSVRKIVERPIGAKTGTTDNATDAWFIGFTPDLALGIHISFDDRTSMGQHATGEEMTGPVWAYIMKDIYQDSEIRDFPIPKNIIFKEIDNQTGLLATPKCKEIVVQAFIKGTEPVKECDETQPGAENIPFRLLRGKKPE
ncbi:MAG: PBP1A family penicillin-binding protein [bacterium]